VTPFGLPNCQSYPISGVIATETAGAFEASRHRPRSIVGDWSAVDLILILSDLISCRNADPMWGVSGGACGGVAPRYTHFCNVI